MSRNMAVLLCAEACFTLICACPGIAKESLAEREAKQTAKEDEAERNAHEVDQIRATTAYVGTVVMGTNGLDQPGPGVVGSLTTTDGQVFQLKLADKSLLEKLKSLNNKKGSITGKLRVEGKYLVVSAVSAAVPPPPGGAAPEVRKRGGI